MAADADATPRNAERLHSLAASVREQLDEVEAELAELDRVREPLRDDRDRLRRALRAVDPSFEPESKPGPRTSRKRRSGTYGVSEESLAAMGETIRKHAGEFDGEGFTATALTRLPDWQWGQAHTAQAIRAMHDRGTIRLDHVGTGGGRWYVLV